MLSLPGWIREQWDRDMVRVGVGLVGLALLALGWWTVVRGGPLDVDAPAPQVVETDPELAQLPPARLAATVVYDLTHIMERMEEAVPVRFGNLGDRSPHPGHGRVEVAYRAERTLFETVMEGEYARITATVSYAGRAWYDPPLLPTISAGCGTEVGDPQPRLRLGLSSRLHLDEDWILRSRVRVDRVEAASEETRDRCRITPLQVDVTGTVVRAVQGLLEDRSGEIDRRVAAVDLRSRLQEVWNTLEEPVELTEDVWLLVNPRRVIRGRTEGRGTVLNVEVGMIAYPAIHLGPPPDTFYTDLPALEDGEVEESSRISLEGRLHYAEAGELLTRELQDRELEVGRRLIRIQRLALRGAGAGRIALEVEFEGSARGRIFLVGRPELVGDGTEILVPDLTFDLETRNLLVGGLAWLAQEQVLAFLRERARIPVARIMAPAREQLLRGLNRDLSDEVRVEGEVFYTRLLDVRALREAMVVHAEADARATFLIHQGGGDE